MTPGQAMERENGALKNGCSCVPNAREALTILLVEDNRLVREVTGEVLRAAGHKVLKASGPAQALNYFRRDFKEIDLVISDVVMPGKTGIELAAELKCKRPNLTVLLTSGYPQASVSGKGEEGSIGYLTKPYSAAALLEKIDELLSEKELP